jgi:hypothetical protein
VAVAVAVNHLELSGLSLSVPRVVMVSLVAARLGLVVVVAVLVQQRPTPMVVLV